MATNFSFARQSASARAATSEPKLRIADDMAMLRAAAELTRDLHAPRPAIYWADMLASALVGWGALALAMTAGPLWLALLAGLVSALALYRAESFIHEISHIKHSAVPGFRAAWNVLVGVPLLTPSFMYEGVHNQHHAKTRYGTADDPEYLPLALMKPWTLPVFILAALFAPVALLFRYAVLAPLSLVVPGLRAEVVARFSALSINPVYRRRPAEGEALALWQRLEIVTSLWAITVIALVAGGVVSLKAFLIFMAVVSLVAVVNQTRTLVAHLWENEGEPMSVTAQYLDSVNVPPPAMLPLLWAPVGLRYHALHHLLPGVPYHALGEAHRRLSAALDDGSVYHRASYKGLFGLVRRLAAQTMR
ncbi:fatty acid desaturase [Sphingomonas sp.]|uniref:fatty acid desaturase family protein n=1 Tax=Sphingomonas sp. TaxID=28214 RepID=UPI001D20CC26|nr:fatty acid desaturase [Sphingomonas sp.]MBX9797177.1 fatty acid desaturase [Sphingomonas sp.]